MKRRRITRIQLLLLVLLALLVLVRMITGPPPPDGLVVMVDLEPFEVEHQAFEVMQPTRAAIQAVGSFEEEGLSPDALAAYGWIVRREDRRLVWQQQAAASTTGRGRSAHTTDTLSFEPGIYDVYFASYGDRYASENDRRRAQWRRDADQWQFVVNPLDEMASAQLTRDQRSTAIVQSLPGLFWTTAPMRSRQEESYLFEVKEPAEVRIYAVGEVDDEVADVAWIEDVANRERVWTFSDENTEPAGGIKQNRKFEGTLALSPGTYRVVSQSDNDHAFNDWNGNPPYDPAGWGMTIQAEEGTLAAFDPWTSRRPLISFTRVGDREEQSQRFEVLQPIEVVAYGMGEITDGGVYDYGELLREEASRKESFWKMSRSRSGHAGGGDKNRVEIAFLTLDPGVYTLRYVTDGSHAFDDWNTGRPDYPERWGITLFPMNPNIDESSFRLLSNDHAWDWETPDALNAPLPPGVTDGEALVSWAQVRGGQNLRQLFTLNEEARLHIVAQGEISEEGQYDYGWIEKRDSEERVWVMTYDNTRHAGGADRNRRFDGLATLPAGEYVARFRTDDSHHPGSYEGEAPDADEEWGMTISRVEGAVQASGSNSP